MDSQNQSDELYPIAVLIDELKVIGPYLQCLGSDDLVIDTVFATA